MKNIRFFCPKIFIFGGKIFSIIEYARFRNVEVSPLVSEVESIFEFGNNIVVNWTITEYQIRMAKKWATDNEQSHMDLYFLHSCFGLQSWTV